MNKNINIYHIHRRFVPTWHIVARGGGETGGDTTSLTKKKLISRAISTQELGNLPYHVKTICSYQQKALKRKQFHPENEGNVICETLNFKIFPGEYAPGPPYNPGNYAPCRTDECRPPPKNFLSRTPITSHGMIKFGRANSPNTPPPQQKDGSFAPDHGSQSSAFCSQ